MSQGQLAWLLEQVVGKGQYQLIDGQDGSPVPVAGRFAKAGQPGRLLWQDAVLQRSQPVVVGAGPQIGLDGRTVTNVPGDRLDALMGFRVVPVGPTPHLEGDG